jgi:flavin reductase (DIM6/NTAB) family NADH-FMN oxidoreductase RutF
MTFISRVVDVQPPPSTDDFKQAMRGVAGAVSVITVADGDAINGMTVTSVSSFSAEPPTMLVSINQSASSYPTLRKTGTFAINILGAAQRAIAERFSGIGGLKGAARFAQADWTRGLTGAPLLVGAAAAFDCTLEDVLERHSHALVIGRICSLKTDDGAGALIYRRGEYVSMGVATDTDLRS